MAGFETVDIHESQEKPQKSKRSSNRGATSDDYDGEDDDSRRVYNRLVLSMTKPSYLLNPSSKSFRPEHRERLCKLLRELVRQHNWKEASGVLSVLMQGTNKDRSPELNRLKYSVCMEILKRIQGDSLNSSRIDQIYDTWISRIGSSKDRLVEDRSMVYLEQILHFLTEGNNDNASEAATSLMQRPEFGSSPLSYMVIGLTFYQLFYSKYLKEIQCDNTDQTPSESEMSGTGFNDPIGLSEGQAAYSHETEASFRCESETSVMNERRIPHMSKNNFDGEASMEVDVKFHRDGAPQPIQPQRVYATSDENQGSLQNNGAPTFDASLISVLEGMESWLFPIRLPQNSDYYMQMLNDPNYKEAVKCLRLALHSTPPVFAALHPLVQLLLIGGQVDDAMKEVEESCNNSSAALPFRIRASILECFNTNSPMLSKYYEDVLKKDPTCRHSLAKLVKMHQYGDYSPESLVEMIARHLDATYAEHDTWREFALCFLKLCQGDEDRMSVCVDGKGAEKKQHYSVRYNRTPQIFTEGKSGRAWKLRCKWWLTRHFSNKMLSSEIAKGDLQLLTYKAACASHMYGQDFGYVLKVYGLVENDSNRDLFMFLQMHRQNSVRIYPNFFQ